LGSVSIHPFTIQLGSLSYGFRLDGILGVDFLLELGAVIDFDQMIIRKGKDKDGTS